LNTEIHQSRGVFKHRRTIGGRVIRLSSIRKPTKQRIYFSI